MQQPRNLLRDGSPPTMAGEDDTERDLLSSSRHCFLSSRARSIDSKKTSVVSPRARDASLEAKPEALLMLSATTVVKAPRRHRMAPWSLFYGMFVSHPVAFSSLRFVVFTFFGVSVPGQRAGGSFVFEPRGDGKLTFFIDQSLQKRPLVFPLPLLSLTLCQCVCVDGRIIIL